MFSRRTERTPIIQGKIVTHLVCIKLCTSPTSRTLFTLGLNTANQSLPSFFSSGGTECGSSVSRKSSLSVVGIDCGMMIVWKSGLVSTHI